MPGPVDGNPPSGSGYDPYADGTGGTGSTTDLGGDTPDQYPVGDTGGSNYVGPQDGGSGGPTIKTQDYVDQLQSQYDSIKSDANIPYADKNKLLKELGDLIKKVKALPEGAPIPADLQKGLDAFQAEAAGATAPADATGDGGQGGDPTAQLKTDLTAYKASIESQANLTPAQKTEYEGKIDQWISGLDSKLLTPEDVQPLFDQLKTDVASATAYSPTTQSLAQITGKTPDEIDALFKKYNLDPAHLPNPPDSNVAALLNDPDLGLADLKQGVADAYKGLTDEIGKQTKAANDLNAANTASDTSNQDNLDVSSFKYLYDASQHKDDQSNALVEARNNLADKTASILSAMYGGTTVTADHNKPGCVVFNGTEMNVASSSQSGNINLDTAKTDVDWPDVQLVTYQVDNEGDGKTPPVQWMNDAHYPISAYDSSSSAYGWWKTP